MTTAAVYSSASIDPAPARLGIGRLALTEFRCYRALRLALDGRPVVLTGPNGAGKTNLLEALSLLAPGRGLRRARLADIRRRDAAGEAGWAVAVTIRGPHGPFEVGTGLVGAGERRVVRIDGEPANAQAELARLLGVVWLTPEMDRLFLEGSGARRRFLDRMIYGFDPDHARRLAAYEHAMRERTRLLRSGRRDEAWLAALEETMAANGVAIAASRRVMAGRLRGALAEATGPFPRARLEVEGMVEGWLDEMPALEAEERFAARLAANRMRDAEAGRALDGVHRTDIAVTHLDREVPAAECSTGEQKALLIALVLADVRLRAAEREGPLLLLLDEVTAHLDAERRGALLDEIAMMEAQTWITGTDPGQFDGLGDRAQRLAVAGGVVTPLR